MPPLGQRTIPPLQVELPPVPGLVRLVFLQQTEDLQPVGSCLPWAGMWPQFLQVAVNQMQESRWPPSSQDSLPENQTLRAENRQAHHQQARHQREGQSQVTWPL